QRRSCPSPPTMAPSQSEQRLTRSKHGTPSSVVPRHAVMAAAKEPRSGRGTRTQQCAPSALMMSSGMPAPVRPRNWRRAAVQYDLTCNSSSDGVSAVALSVMSSMCAYENSGVLMVQVRMSWDLSRRGFLVEDLSASGIVVWLIVKGYLDV